MMRTPLSLISSPPAPTPLGASAASSSAYLLDQDRAVLHRVEADRPAGDPVEAPLPGRSDPSKGGRPIVCRMERLSRNACSAPLGSPAACSACPKSLSATATELYL